MNTEDPLNSDCTNQIKKIIQNAPYITEIEKDNDDNHPLQHLEETQSQLVDSVFGSCNLRSQKVKCSSGARQANLNLPSGSLFRSGISNFTVSEDEVDDNEDQNAVESNHHDSGEIDLLDLQPPDIRVIETPLTYDQLNVKCKRYEELYEKQKKKNYQFLDYIEKSNEKIKALEEIEKAAYQQIDQMLQQISELQAKNLTLEEQNSELKNSLDLEQKKKKQEFINSNSNINQVNAMLQIKDKQIQLLQGQLANLKAATQYRSQGSHHSNASAEKDKNTITNIINNNNRNQIIIRNEIVQGNIQKIQKTKAETPKKQQQSPVLDFQQTQRSKKNIEHQKQNNSIQTRSWLENLKNRNNEELNKLQSKQQNKEKEKHNSSFTDNVQKYVHKEVQITKVNSPAFQRQTTYLSLNDNDNSLIQKARTLKNEFLN